MSLAILYSRASHGIVAPIVTVEAHLSNGLPKLSIVGLPETAVKESKDRVRSAILNSKFEFPRRRITVNLAPADLPKDGGRFDLPIALGILAASDQIPRTALDQYEFAGELALSGELRSIHGVLPFALATQKAKRQLVIPELNIAEAGLVNQVNILPALHLLDVCAHLSGNKPLLQYVPKTLSPINQNQFDLSDVYGQQHAKYALEIAAAGGHSLLMIGPPGTGKSMLATRLPTILPDMSEAQALETAAILSISQQGFDPLVWQKRPFRTPHHTASSVALVGGGNPPRPGEISLAHNGVLFLDELPEFNRHVLEALREPLETGKVTISRAARQAEFPAKFQLISAMNPCPCGYAADPSGRCRCTSEQIERYHARLSGPLLDRIDMHVEVARIPEDLLICSAQQKPASSAEIKQHVIQARAQQFQRSQCINAHLAGRALEEHCQLQTKDRAFLFKAIKQLELSTRSYHRILRVARTIADLTHSKTILQAHLQQALAYRKLERTKY